MHTFVVITGCSGGGKSTLLAELAKRGHAVVEEPGRRIVRQELASGGIALPWNDMAAFARRARAMAAADYRGAVGHMGWTFFDRSVIDAASALEHLTGLPVLAETASVHSYHRRVFFAQAWPALFAADAERQHSLDDAIAESGRLQRDYTSLGYEIVELPRTDVAARADFVLGTLGAPPLPV